jgi:hypothetical protein
MNKTIKPAGKFTRLDVTRHQSFAVVYLLGDVFNTAEGRALRDRFAKLRGEAYRINLGARQVALLARTCAEHLRTCSGCMGDEAAGQILLALTPAATGPREFDTEARAEVGGLYRLPTIFSGDMIVKVSAAYCTDRDPSPYSHGECADLDIIAGGDPGQFSLSSMTTRSYTLHPIKLPTA